MDRHAFIHTIRIRYADTDQMGVVYHARYFEWFESARTEMLRKAGMPYHQLEKEGFLLPVIEAYCRYKKPVRYDELIRVATTIGELHQATIRIDYQIFGEEEDIIRGEGYTRHCYLSRQGRPVRAPQHLMDLMRQLPYWKGECCVK